MKLNIKVLIIHNVIIKESSKCNHLAQPNEINRCHQEEQDNNNILLNRGEKKEKNMHRDLIIPLF